MIQLSSVLDKTTNRIVFIGLEEIKTKLNHLLIETKLNRTIKFLVWFGSVHGLLFIFLVIIYKAK